MKLKMFCNKLNKARAPGTNNDVLLKRDADAAIVAFRDLKGHNCIQTFLKHVKEFS